MNEPQFNEKELKLFRMLVDNMIGYVEPEPEEAELFEKIYQWITYKEKF